MKEFNSFEKYAGDLLYNEIFQKLNGYIYANKDRLDLATYEVPDPSHVKLEDFEVTSAWFDNAPGYQLVFDLICSTEVEAVSYTHLRRRRCDEWGQLTREH